MPGISCFDRILVFFGSKLGTGHSCIQQILILTMLKALVLL